MKLLHKAICWVSGELQIEDIDLDLLHSYASVTPHEPVRTIIAYES